MDYYELDFDEAIIIQSSNVTRDGYDESEFEDEYLREIILTNKRIMYVIAPDDEADGEDCDIIDVPLNAVKVINGQAQVKQVQHDLYNLCLQVQFVHGVEYWRFGIKAKQQIPVWVNKISDAVRSIPAVCECTHEKPQNSSVHQNKHTSSADTCFCMNCGVNIDRTAKFCPECGVKCGKSEEKDNQRRVVYDGVVRKCPNCGDLLDAFELKCDSCGYELQGNKGSTVVQDFADEIKRLQEEGGRGVNKRIATYISTFPIPNSKVELLEFLVLSASNIEIKNYSFGASDIPEAKKAISNAYYAKFEQAYRKAEAIFGDSPDFADFKAIYRQKKHEITAAKRRRAGIILAIILGVVALFGGIIASAVASSNSQSKVDSEKVALENDRLNSIVQEIYAAIENKNYTLARTKTASLVFAGPDTSEAKKAEKKWDETRKELLEAIDKAEYGEDYIQNPSASNKGSSSKDKSSSFWGAISDFFSGDNEAATTSTTEGTPSEATDIVYSDISIDPGSEYTYMNDEWNVYVATAISDKIIKIENWDKSLSSEKSVSYSYEVGTYKIGDPSIGFSWIDSEKSAFMITLQDKQNSSGGLKKEKRVTFTINMSSSDTNKGSNYSKDITCYSFQNDDWHLYRAIPLTSSLMKIEVWHRTFSFGSFIYGYDACVINTNNDTTDFEWASEECNAFTITMIDKQNSSYWKEERLVSFGIENSDCKYDNVLSYLEKRDN